MGDINLTTIATMKEPTYVISGCYMNGEPFSVQAVGIRALINELSTIQYTEYFDDPKQVINTCSIKITVALNKKEL